MCRSLTEAVKSVPMACKLTAKQFSFQTSNETVHWNRNVANGRFGSELVVGLSVDTQQVMKQVYEIFGRVRCWDKEHSIRFQDGLFSDLHPFLFRRLVLREMALLLPGVDRCQHRNADGFSDERNHFSVMYKFNIANWTHSFGNGLYSSECPALLK